MARGMPPELRVTRLTLSGTPVLVISHAIAPAGARAPAWSEAALTQAEREILRMLRSGRTYAEIAATRGRALGTVKKQIAAIYQKLGVGSRSELVARLDSSSGS